MCGNLVKCAPQHAATDQVGFKRSKKEALFFSKSFPKHVTTGEKKGSCPHFQSQPTSAAFHVFPFWDPCRNLWKSDQIRCFRCCWDYSLMRSKWRLNMAVLQTSKAGINCLHHQSHEPIYTNDKYGKHRPFLLPQTAKIQKPSNIVALITPC